jgi:hypothetical protein
MSALVQCGRDFASKGLLVSRAESKVSNAGVEEMVMYTLIVALALVFFSGSALAAPKCNVQCKIVLKDGRTIYKKPQCLSRLDAAACEKAARDTKEKEYAGGANVTCTGKIAATCPLPR